MAGEWIQTYTGKQFFPLQPRAEDIDVRDIAHALSMQCRFNGHCRAFYSVAEHSVRVSQVLANESRTVQLSGLMHDAAEAYLSDLPRPVKQQMTEFVALKDALLAMICGHFDLPWPLPGAVVHADEMMLATEARDLMAEPPAQWNLEADPLPGIVQPVAPHEAEQAFLARFEELTG